MSIITANNKLSGRLFLLNQYLKKLEIFSIVYFDKKTLLYQFNDFRAFLAYLILKLSSIPQDYLKKWK